MNMARQQTVSVTSGTKRPNFSKLKRDSRTFKFDFDSAMYYAHYELTSKQLKTHTIKLIKNKKLDFKTVDAVDTIEFVTIGKIAYIVNSGGELTEEWEKYMKTRVEELVELGKKTIEAKKKLDVEEEAKPAAKVINIQDRLRDQASIVAAEFDGWVDDFISNPVKFKTDEYDPHTKMVLANFKAGQAHWIRKFYEDDADEIRLALVSKDDQIAEAYDYATKPQLKRLLKLYDMILAAATVIIDTSKTTRKPRQKKAVSVDKIVEKLKFKVKDIESGLVSVNARDIVGAKELWVYNTKTRKLGRYIALDGDGLSVKSATITNFNETTSVEKTLRKPKVQLKEFKNAGKIILRKFMDNITTMDTKLKSRLNEHHILLKVVK